jgi:hypothetical protein
MILWRCWPAVVPAPFDNDPARGYPSAVFFLILCDVYEVDMQGDSGIERKGKVHAFCLAARSRQEVLNRDAFKAAVFSWDEE